MSLEAYDAIVVGAGPSGLASSRELARAGVRHLVVERGPTIGNTWAHLYEGLVLHTGKHLSALPGMPFPESTPLFPTRRHFLDYLQRYADAHQLPVRTRAEVKSVRRDGQHWTIELGDGVSLRGRVLVIATGIVSNPHVPAIANRSRFTGHVMHSVDYRRPEPFANQRVLVVGAGNSSGEISAELASAGARVSVAVRSGARVVPRELLGVPIQYVGVALRSLPRPLLKRAMSITSALGDRIRGPSPLPPPLDSPCATVPLIGFHLTDGIRSGRIQLRPGVSEFTSEGVRFSDGAEEPFDTVILATGYRAALGMLDAGVHRDQCGFAVRRHRVVSADYQRLYFVGHNYDVAGGLRNIAEDARRASRLIAAELRGTGRT
jgi:cation diffusion facilitator CzcD-associated flavoprotein CzcO